MRTDYPQLPPNGPQTSGLVMLQSERDDLFRLINNSLANLKRELFIRRSMAYLLKAVSIFGGIAIAAGLQEYWAHLVGVAVAVAVGIDLLLTNHNRLIAATEAAYAYESLRETSGNRFNVEQARLIVGVKNADPESTSKYFDLLDNSIKRIRDSMSEITKSLAKSDIDGLRALSLKDRDSGQ